MWLLLLLIPASLTTYLDDQAVTVYSISSNASVLELDMQPGQVVYAVTNNGEIQYEWKDGRLILYGGDNVTNYVVKISRPITNSMFTLYNNDLNVREHVLYIPENASIIHAYPEPTTQGNPLYWFDNSKIYSIEYIKSEDENNTYFLLAVIILIGVLVLYYWFFIRKLKTKVEDFEKKISGFPHYEREILRLVHANEGIRQAEIQAKLNLRKAHVSKLLAKMEARFLVKRERIGRVVKVYLGEFFCK